jgi:ATP-binding cassette, subfamily B, bacterial
MKNPYFSMLRIAWRYARQEQKRFILIYSMFVVTNIIIALNPLLYGWFVDNLQKEGTAVLQYAWLYAGAYLGLKLLEWAFHGPARVMERKLAFSLSKNFLDELYHQVLHLPVNWHQNNHSGATINRIRKAYESLKEFFQHGFIYLAAIGKMVFSITAMMYFSPVFGSIGVIMGLLTIYIIFQFDKPFVKALKECNEKQHHVSANLFDSLSNIITVITLRLEKRMKTSLLDKIDHVFPPFKKQITINEWKWFTATFMIALIYTIIVTGYIYQHWESGKTFQIAGLIILIGYVHQFSSVFSDVAYQYTRILQFNTDVQTALNISESYEKQHRPLSAATIPTHWKSIHIANLNFDYTSKNSKKGLSNIQLVIPKGKKIAFIGESGSGKSTLLALLRGLQLPEDQIQIRIDCKTTSDFSLITNTVTLFPQEPEIFENTIRYNITLGLPFSEQEITKACETACFSAVLEQLPEHLESNIAEKGVNLSGGQKQRLALARGILAANGSNIILLDEPTSSIDPKTEKLIYSRLFEKFSDRAIISSIHRLHLLHMFDYIYILKEGQIVDEGSFESLKNHSSAFREMWKYQEGEKQEEMA